MLCERLEVINGVYLRSKVLIITSMSVQEMFLKYISTVLLLLACNWPDYAYVGNLSRLEIEKERERVHRNQKDAFHV